MTDDQDTVSRRSVLRSSAVATGSLVAGAAVTGGVAGVANEGGKRGGRAQAEGDVRRNEPFTLRLEGMDTRGASCMSAESADQVYLTYDIWYCDSDEDDDSDATMYVTPDEAELVETETYVIRSVQQCRANDLLKVAFGPAPHGCP